uniref:Uncharacterized protein n=1 Tax=Romanomermis culicivorax TaxID=13658 RepID=A0A915K8K4_ROMCU
LDVIPAALPLCSVTGNEKLIFILGSQALYCSNKFWKIFNPNSDLNGKCNLVREGGSFPVVSRNSRDLNLWMMCDSGNKLVIEICQIHIGCVPYAELMEYTSSDYGTPCKTMARKLKSKLFWSVFIGPNAKCDLSSMLTDILSKDNTGKDQHLHILSDLDERPPPPPTTSMHESIFACRHGIYENVFYNASGAPTHCVIHFAHQHRGKCLPVHKLIDVISREALLPYKVNSLEDNTIEYRRFILV